MRDQARIIGLAIRLAVRAGGWRVPVIVACSVSIALQPAANAFALKLLTDGVLARDWVAAATGIGMLAALIAVMFSVYGVWVPLQTAVSERAARRFEQDVMGLVSAIPTLEPHERSDFANKLDVLRENSQVLIGALWSLLSSVSFLIGAGAALALLVSVEPLLLLLPLFGLPLFAMSLRGARLVDQAVERTAEPLRVVKHLFQVGTTPSYGKELRLFRLAPEIANRHATLRRAASRELFRAELKSGLLSTAGWVIFLLAWAAGVVLVISRAVQGRTTPGEVVLILAVAGLVQGYVSGAVGLARDLRYTLNMAARYVWLLNFADGVKAGTDDAPRRIDTAITVDGVSFTYPGTDTEALRDVSVTLPARTTIGIVGDNGAGKTTFIKLLLGLYHPTSGRIHVDGQDLNDIAPEAWRSRLAGAFQDFVKPELRLGQAVGIGRLDDVDDEPAVRAAIVRAGATHLPDVDQQLGTAWDGGVDLSGGQWQHVAVSRGLMRDRPLLRVLDEPTAALDADVEHALFERYRDIARNGPAEGGGLTLLVSHRLSAVQMADMILVFSAGRIVEQGTHEELMTRDGLYAELFELQARAYR